MIIIKTLKNLKNHVFNKHTKLIIIDKLENQKYHQIKRHFYQRLTERENFGIQMLEMLHPKGLNQESSN